MKKTGLLFVALILVCSIVLSTAYAENILTINIKEASDEELAQAVGLIKAEQRARLKTKIILEPSEIIVKTSSTEKIKASVTELPEGVTAGPFSWTSQNSEIATCAGGTIKGVGSGTTVVTCSTILSDGTEISADCTVKVIIPIKSISAQTNKLEVMASDTFIPEVLIKPENASITDVVYGSADSSVVKVTEDGQLYAVAAGKTTVTVSTMDGSGKSTKINVTVLKKVGKYDDELTYQSISWGSDDKECVAKLTELGILEKGTSERAYNTSKAYLWPENELLFNSTKWHDLPVAFSDLKIGVSRMSLELQKSIGGFEPRTASLYYTNRINSEGKINTNINQLVGVYFQFDNEHEKGTEIFKTLLAKLEAQYGEFTRYIHKDFTRRSYKDVYNAISETMHGAIVFNHRSVEDAYLGIQATCILHGKNNTGIMLTITSDERVTLYYGKTDAWDQIRKLQGILESMKETKDDSGI